jgi:hypothetical protein
LSRILLPARIAACTGAGALLGGTAVPSGSSVAVPAGPVAGAVGGT